MSKSLQDQLLALGIANEKPKKTRIPSRRTPGNADRRFEAESYSKKGQAQGKQAAGVDV